MFSARMNGSGRKTAAQRSRDLFAAMGAPSALPDDPQGPPARLRSLRNEAAARESAMRLDGEAATRIEPPAPHLSVVPASAEPAAETTAARIKRLQAEAQTLARAEVVALERRISELAAFARQVAEGGDAYAVGAREVARRLAEELPRQAGVLEALLRKL